jgi:hypothetical protein
MINKLSKYRKPPIVYSKFRLLFLLLSWERFEDLCVMVAETKGVEVTQHPGRSGQDKGIDIIGHRKEDSSIEVAIQAKRCNTCSKGTLIQIAKDFVEKSPEFEGEFWIITCANVSQEAIDQAAKEFRDKKIKLIIIAGSQLENIVKKNPSILNEFFAEKDGQENLVTIKKIVIRFKEKFLYELNRSFPGNYSLIMERQKILYELVQTAKLDLKSELVSFPNDAATKLEELVKKWEKSAKGLISNYRLKSEMNNGRFAFGKDVGMQAMKADDDKMKKFLACCEEILKFNLNA